MEIEIDENYLESDLNSVTKPVPRVSSANLTYNRFFHQFMSKNLPVIITDLEVKTEISEKWFDEGKFKIESLLEIINTNEVPVANCSKKCYDSHEKMQMKFNDYVRYWRSSRAAGILYLKDFHLKQEYDLDFYKVPFYFASDWLNEYLIDEKKDDYRFIYIGPKDSW